jgi:hypothetical protein
MARSAAVPLIKNEHVQELLNILKDKDDSQRTALMAVLAHVGKMEQQYKKLEDTLADVRGALAEAEAKSHPAKAEMRKFAISIQVEGLSLRDGLAKLKQNIIAGCRAAVTAVQEKGISALNHATKFLHIRPTLESMRDACDKQIQFDDRAIAKIEQISTEYHEAGRHLKNIGRAILGKEAIETAEPAGKVAKSASAPFRAARSCCAGMRKHAEAALGGLTRLEDRAAGRTSIKADIQTYNQQIAEAKRDAPAPPERQQPSDRNR